MTLGIIKAWVLGGFCLLAFAGCQVAPPKPEGNRLRFFDLKGYFEQEALRLGDIGKATKTVFVGDRKEMLILDSIRFREDLQVFANADINRPAWSDKYSVDSVFDHHSLSQLKYISKDERLRTQSIVIDFDSSRLSKLIIENRTSSFFATSNQLLAYEPRRGYSIDGGQKVALMEIEVFRVIVKFWE